MIRMRSRARVKLTGRLALRGGEWVQVRTEEEILQTLDSTGVLEGLPFMPEMLRFCGQCFKVHRVAHKTCDTINKTGCRRMRNVVHLEMLRCDGEFHGGCQASCLIFWKEAWLKRVEAVSDPPANGQTWRVRGEAKLATGCSLETLHWATRNLSNTDSVDKTKLPRTEVFSCQATQLWKATSRMPWWDHRHYWRDLRYGNRSLGEVLRTILLELFARTLQLRGYRIQLWTFNTLQRLRRRGPYPYRQGKLAKTPREILNLKEGEFVQVKSHDEVLCTLDVNNNNRGLWFDVEQVKYCGGKYRVARRVQKIINEKTGQMMTLPNDCIILEGVTCVGDYHQLCPRGFTPYWREIWLKRAE